MEGIAYKFKKMEVIADFSGLDYILLESWEFLKVLNSFMHSKSDLSNAKLQFGQ